MATRKAIAAALLAQLTAGGQFVATGRRLRAPEQGASAGKPGLFLIKPKERYAYDGGERERGVPPVRTLQFLAVIYTDVGNDETAMPADVIDDLLDAIDSALAPSLLDQMQNGARQTLGGLVYDARAEGDADLAPGDVQGKGTTVVPIKVILVSYP